MIEHIDGDRYATGADEIRALYGPLFDASPDLHAEITSRTNLGNTVIDVEHVRGMNAPDRPFEIRAVVIYRVRGDKIARLRLVNADA